MYSICTQKTWKNPGNPHQYGLSGVVIFIPTRSCQKFSKQICFWDLVQIIGIISIIQIVEAI